MRKQILTAAVFAGCAVTTAAMAADGAGSTTVGARAFVDFTHIGQQSDGADTAATGTGLDVKRAYLMIDHTFDDVWSADLTTDFRYTSSDTDLYIKKVYLQARVNDALVVRAGSADLPWVPFVENLYGYRYIENTLIDRLKFGTSTDWGLNAAGKLGSSGRFQYSVSAINGGGYKTPTRTSSPDYEGRVALIPVTGLTLAAGFYSGHRGLQTQTNPAENTASRWDAVAAYGNSRLRLGAEYFEAKKWNQVQLTAPQTADEADGLSIWGSVNFTTQWAAFARYDDSKPSKQLNPGLKDQYFNIGMAYKPTAGVELALAYKSEKVDNGSISTSNGTIGGTMGSTGTLTDGKYDEVGVWGQLSF